MSNEMASVPDIKLQKPAMIVADITTQGREPSRQPSRGRRRMLRMMMKGAATTRNGTAAKVAAWGPPCSSRKLAGRLVAAWYPVAKTPASANPIARAKKDCIASADMASRKE